VFIRITAVSSCLLLVGCTTLKKAGIVAGATGVVTALTASLVGAPVPIILAATTTAFVTDVVTEAIPIGKETMNNCAPDNFWTLLGSLVEMGGWALILIVLVPMVFSWLLPGPIRFKKKSE
jgi:hypothetical protein